MDLRWLQGKSKKNKDKKEDTLDFFPSDDSDDKTLEKLKVCLSNMIPFKSILCTLCQYDYTPFM